MFTQFQPLVMILEDFSSPLLMFFLNKIDLKIKHVIYLNGFWTSSWASYDSSIRCDIPSQRGFPSFAPAVKITSEQRLSKLPMMVSPGINSYCQLAQQQWCSAARNENPWIF